MAGHLFTLGLKLQIFQTFYVTSLEESSAFEESKVI